MFKTMIEITLYEFKQKECVNCECIQHLYKKICMYKYCNTYYTCEGQEILMIEITQYHFNQKVYVNCECIQYLSKRICIH